MGVVLVERRGRVAILTLNRPAALNGLDDELRLAIKRELEAAAADDTVGVVVLTGAGRGFSAGADLKAATFVSGAEVERQINEEYGGAIRAIARMPKPVVAAVNGFVTGIAASYVLACDLVVMAEQAFFQVPFQRIGLVPDGGMTWLLTERIGHRLAFEIAVSGDRVPAARCLEWGLVNRVVPESDVLENAVAWATELSVAAPMALRLLKQMLRAAPALGLEKTIQAEAQLQSQCIDSQDFREGVAAFRDKRTPKFSGR